MVGFTEPNRYEPRAGWRQTLAQWVEESPGAADSWQQQIAVYWRWRTLDGLSLTDAWEELGMKPMAAKAALAQSTDSGLIPRELFSRVLARSRANVVSAGDNVANVIIAATPETELPDYPEVGFTPERLSPPRPAFYQPRKGWKANLVKWIDFPPGFAGGFPVKLGFYWSMKTQEGKSVQEAWKDLQLDRNNAETSLNPDLEHRGSIPPELIGRVVARSRMDTFDPEPNVKGIILYPELTV